MNYSLREAVRECFNGDRERDCGLCPAHFSSPNRGDVRCCFGDKHDPNDEECHNCIHVEECAAETHGFHPYQVPPSTIKKRSVVSRSERNNLPIIGQQHPVIAPHQGTAQATAVSPKVPFVKQIGLHAAWGAVEGSLGMLLTFFQRRRPQ